MNPLGQIRRTIHWTRQNLTFKSTGINLKNAVENGKLLLWAPEFESDAQSRLLLVHPKLAEDMRNLDAPWQRRVGRLQADFEHFMLGKHVTLSMTPFDHKNSYMGLLDPTREGIWEIRSRDPNPGLRVFGKFPCTDTFVALTWEPRSVRVGDKRPLGSGKSLEYEFAMIEANQRWEETLPELTPLSGGSCSDYVSQNASEV